MTAAVNRFNFTKATVAAGIKFLRGKAKRQPRYLKIRKGSVKDGKLYLDGKLVVPVEEVNSYLRDRIYRGGTPLSRDSAFYAIHQDVVGVGRKAVDHFLKTQRIIRATDAQQPAVKKAGPKVNTKGQLHLDLIELKFKDLPFKPEDRDIDADVSKGYILGIVDALTSLSYWKWHPHKTQSEVTPIVKQAIAWFENKLGVKRGKFTLFSDKGREFSFPTYERWGITTLQLARSPLIEAKNAFFQRTLFRLAKMGTTRNLKKLISQSMTILNKTRSENTKKTPLENLLDPTAAVAKKYNTKRQRAGASRLRAIVPGKDKVRINIVGPKKSLDFKGYKGMSWSKKVYSVTKKRGAKYLVNGKYYTRSELKITAEYDKVSDQLLRTRETARQVKEDRERAVRRKKMDAPKPKANAKKKPKGSLTSVDTANIITGGRRGRSTRAQKAKEKLRKMMDRERALDREGL